MTHVVLVCGPPCSGKSTVVRENMSPGDLVVDFDWIARGIGGEVEHQHPDQIVPHVSAVYGLLLQRVRDGLANKCRAVWIVKCSPNADDLAMVDEVLVAPTPKGVCIDRARAQGREQRTLDFIHAWSPPAGHR